MRTSPRLLLGAIAAIAVPSCTPGAVSALPSDDSPSVISLSPGPTLSPFPTSTVTPFIESEMNTTPPQPIAPIASSTATEAPALAPTPRPSPTIPATLIDGPTWITESDNGKAFRYYLTIRFGLDLDPSRYAYKDLDYSECTFLGQISNWSLNGPESLPVGFEATEPGSCEMRVAQFHVQIVASDWP